MSDERVTSLPSDGTPLSQHPQQPFFPLGSRPSYWLVVVWSLLLSCLRLCPILIVLSTGMILLYNTELVSPFLCVVSNIQDLMLIVCCWGHDLLSTSVLPHIQSNVLTSYQMLSESLLRLSRSTGAETRRASPESDQLPGSREPVPLTNQGPGP